MKKLILGICMLVGLGLFAADGIVSLSSGYPGGNLKIVKQDPGKVVIDADLRDSKKWFYWNFEAEAKQPGKVRFLFPEKTPRMSAQGPAYSTDGGKTWQWIGKKNVTFCNKNNPNDFFEWTFSKAGEKVRFAQGIPYQKKNFDDFIAQYKNSPVLKQQVLTKTRRGVDTPLLVIGNGPKNILVTARHHSCEAIPSYAMEGFLAEALSDSPAGKAFRAAYTLYAVPFVDLDGVEAGDQGKGRQPHDHNRDYGLGDAALYPEIKAIIALDKEKKFFITLDLHAPALRNDIHEAIYFAGYATETNKVNTPEFKSWLDDERPGDAGRIILLSTSKIPTPDGTTGIANALYFGLNPTTTYAMTIEIAYANSNINYNGAVIREYGTAILKALLKTEFSKDLTPRTAYKKYADFKKSLSLGRPDRTIEKCTEELAKKDLPPHYRCAALNQRAFFLCRVKKYEEALRDSEAVLAEPEALREQKYTAITQKTRILCSDPDTKLEVVEKWLKTVMDQKLVSGTHLYDTCELFYGFFKKNGKVAVAKQMADLQLPYASYHQIGKIRNRIAAYELQHGDKEKVAEYCRETVALMKPQLFPKLPIGVIGPPMAIDYIDALMMIPGTPAQEIIDVAEMALAHKICRPNQREYLTKIVESLKEKGSKK